MGFYVCLVENSDKLYLLTNRDGEVIGGEKQELLDYWTDGWERALGMGGGFHTSACLSFIFFQPSVVWVENTDELEEIVGGIPFTEYTVRTEGSWIEGILCESEIAREYYDRGDKPEFFRK